MAEPWQDDDGYWIERRKGHPLATGADHKVKVHRRVLFDEMRSAQGLTAEQILHAQVPCWWCEWMVRWDITYRPGGSKDERWSALVVDHLDGNRANNDPNNVVASCPWCNSNRGHDHKAVEHKKYIALEPKDRPPLGELKRQKAAARKAVETASEPTPIDEVEAESGKPPTRRERLREWFAQHRKRMRCWVAGVVASVLVLAFIAIGPSDGPFLAFGCLALVALMVVWARGPGRGEVGGRDETVAPVPWQSQLPGGSRAPTGPPKVTAPPSSAPAPAPASGDVSDALFSFKLLAEDLDDDEPDDNDEDWDAEF